MELINSERAQLRQVLMTLFDLTELKDLAFDLGVDYQLFSHETKGEFSRELIGFCERRDKLNMLVNEAFRQRPKNDFLPLLVARFPQTNNLFKKIQIIVAEELLEDISQFLDTLALRLNCSRDEVVLISATWGSTRLLVSLPIQIANMLLGSQMVSLLDDKYQIVSISDFDALDLTSQNTWRYISQHQRPIQKNQHLFPSVAWEDALKLAFFKNFPLPASNPGTMSPVAVDYLIDQLAHAEMLIPTEYATRVLEANTRLAEQQVEEKIQSMNQKMIYARITIVLSVLALVICLALIGGAGFGILQFPDAVVLALIFASVVIVASLTFLVFRYFFSNGRPDNGS